MMLELFQLLLCEVKSKLCKKSHSTSNCLLVILILSTGYCQGWGMGARGVSVPKIKKRRLLCSLMSSSAPMRISESILEKTCCVRPMLVFSVPKQMIMSWICAELWKYHYWMEKLVWIVVQKMNYFWSRPETWWSFPVLFFFFFLSDLCNNIFVLHFWFVRKNYRDYIVFCRIYL